MLPHPKSNPNGSIVLWVSGAEGAGTCHSGAGADQPPSRRSNQQRAVPRMHRTRAARGRCCGLRCPGAWCHWPRARQVWDRETNTWTPVETPINSICGGWAKLHDGNVGMFAGHYQVGR